MVYEVFSALDMLVLERKQPGSFAPIGSPPPVFVLLGMSARRDPVEVFPYLADFLPEASAIWTSGGRLDSGMWVQQDCKGAERAMEASAVGAGDRNYLVLRVLGSEYEERKSAVKKARETSLLYASLRELARDLANARDELAERNREVERLDRLKSELLANMSHELRTPLNAIIGFSSLLGEERPGTLDADQKEFVAHVQRAARHLMSLISDILDLSKIEAGCLTLERETFALAGAVTDALSTERAQIESKGLHLQVEADMTFRVYADRVRFTQILLNLLSNAVKFTPPGGTITIRSQHMEGGDLAISVCDTGIGIPAEEHSAIFDKFHQVGSGTRGTREGTGLGLAITKALVEAHGGSIRVESAPGAGSRFTFCLPSTAGGAADEVRKIRVCGRAGPWISPGGEPPQRRYRCRRRLGQRGAGSRDVASQLSRQARSRKAQKRSRR